MKSQIDLYKELQIATSFDADKTYPSLFQHLGYRKHIAEQLLYGEYNEEHKESLMESYKYINNIIIEILGLHNEKY